MIGIRGSRIRGNGIYGEKIRGKRIRGNGDYSIACIFSEPSAPVHPVRDRPGPQFYPGPGPVWVRDLRVRVRVRDFWAGPGPGVKKAKKIPNFLKMTSVASNENLSIQADEIYSRLADDEVPKKNGAWGMK